MEPPLIFGCLLAIGVAIASLFASYRSQKKRRLLEALPTSATQGVFIGLVELTGIHEGFGFQSEFRSGADFTSEQISGAQVNKVVLVYQEGTLGALSGPGRAKENKVEHGRQFNKRGPMAAL